MKTYSVSITRRKLTKGDPIQLNSSRRAYSPVGAVMKALRQATIAQEIEPREEFTVHVERTDA